MNDSKKNPQPEVSRSELEALVSSGDLAKPDALQTLTVVSRLHGLSFGPFSDTDVAAMLLKFHEATKEHYDNLVDIHRKAESKQ